MEKVIDITERVPAMKKRRKRRTNFKFIALITIFLLIIVVLLYFQLPYSNIKKIDIKGAALREDAFYLQQSTLQVDDSLWGFKTSEVEQSIAENEWIKSVDVKRKFLNDVEIPFSDLLVFDIDNVAGQTLGCDQVKCSLYEKTPLNIHLVK